MQRKYIILSLKHSTKNETTFWRDNDAGYTTNPWAAGIYSEEQVLKNPDYYNDGYNAVAICINNSTLPISGIKISLNQKAVKAYRVNRKGA